MAQSRSYAPSNDAMVLGDVHRTFTLGRERVAALGPVTLRVQAGEFVAIMGTSGSGKSTLLNILGLLDTPTEGTYTLFDHPVASLDDAARARMRGEHLGFVFQSFHLLAKTRAVDNVALPLLYRGVSTRERHRAALAALERVGLGHRAQHMPNELSGGQQQRVALARALINGPKVLLADEPTGNLDSATTQEVMAMLKQLHRGGLTIVLVTHEPDIAQQAQRVLTMQDGRVVHDGPPAQAGEQ